MRWRFRTGQWNHVERLVAFQVCLWGLTYLQAAAWFELREPVCLITPAIAPIASYLMLAGWAYHRFLPWAVGLVLMLVGGLLPFAFYG